MSSCFEDTFSKFQCDFRQNFSSQFCLMFMTEKWKKSVHKGETIAALHTDLSKAFDCLPHDLVIAILNAYGFSFSAARLIQSHFSNKKQSPKITNGYNS